MSYLMRLCHRIKESREKGFPLMSVADRDTLDTATYELACHYIAANTGGQVRKERADL